jgi:hypothetical protein
MILEIIEEGSRVSDGVVAISCCSLIFSGTGA